MKSANFFVVFLNEMSSNFKPPPFRNIKGGGLDMLDFRKALNRFCFLLV